MVLIDKVQYVFNKILLNMIKEIKDKDPGLKKHIKTNYSVFDKSTDAHVTHFIANTVDGSVYEVYHEDKDEETGGGVVVDLLSHESVLQCEFLKDVKVVDVINVIDETEKEVVKSYLYILYMLSVIYTRTKELDNVKDEDKDYEFKLNQMGVLFNKCVNMISGNGEDTDETENIFDDTLCAIFKNIYRSREHIQKSCILTVDEFTKNVDEKDNDNDTQNASGFGMGEGGGGMFDFLNNSKIGQLAKEITEDIDIKNLDIKDPSELLNIESMFNGGGNNVLGDIIAKVGSKVASKISNGELKHEDLMGEAMAMMGKMGGMGGAMGAMGGFAENMRAAAAGSGKDPHADLFEEPLPMPPQTPRNLANNKTSEGQEQSPVLSLPSISSNGAGGGGNGQRKNNKKNKHKR